MYEDPAIELEAFAPFSRVFCIAAAGCTARALSAAGHDVTAVDINPWQILYARTRAAGGAAREGAAERLLARARRLLPLLGWTENRRREILSLRDPAEQLHYWRRTLDSLRWRVALDALLSASLLRFAYASPFTASLPRHLGAHVRARLERAWASHANRSNPYAWRLLLGETQFGRSRRPYDSFRVRRRSRLPGGVAGRELRRVLAIQYRRRRAILLCQRLYRAVQHAAAPGAMVVARSFAEPTNRAENNRAARDRSLLWGAVNVSQAGDSCSTF